MIKYREDKTTQAAGHFLSLSEGSINYMKLIKLLYFADRQALLSFGRPITFDSYVSMKNGPVLSFTLDRINTKGDGDYCSYWHEYISDPNNYIVDLNKDTPVDMLSKAEIDTLNKIWNEFGEFSEWDLVEKSHDLPEWQDPNGSTRPIEIVDIFSCEGYSKEEYQNVMELLAAEEYADEILGNGHN